ncbi:hypothetical protein BN1180_05102 [Peribacillus simplex]|uniref:Uncharacterized protein n=1 Tax=Peribacillus simplex TaxID=1478 RepID=A0AAN2PMC9_9BACI|nr:hypothetical protein BN1180_05102 [Peribacillus simplex]
MQKKRLYVANQFELTIKSDGLDAVLIVGKLRMCLEWLKKYWDCSLKNGNKTKRMFYY